MKDYTGFVFLMLDKRDKLILLVVAIAIVLAELAYFNFLKIDSNTTSVWVSVCLYLGPWWLIGVRFRNILFSIIWFILIFQYYELVPFKVAFMPLAGFICYQITRIIFWLNNKREFIPTMFGYTHFRNRFSKILNTWSDDGDAVYAVVLFFGLVGLTEWWL